MDNLAIGHNQISDLTSIQGLTKLRTLYLLPNPIKSYSPVEEIYENLNFKDFALNSVTSITISGSDMFEIPKTGTITSQYTAVARDENDMELTDEGIIWSLEEPTSTLRIDKNGLLVINSTVIPKSYTVIATSRMNNSISSTMSISLTTPSAIAPELTGFTWDKGSSIRTTKATVVPAGTLKYIVGAVGSQVQPNVGDAATAYTNILKANTDIAILSGQHIFIIEVGTDGKIASWADVAVSESNINLEYILGDVNDDGDVDSVDLALIKAYLLGKTDNINMINSDINYDGYIDAIDFALLNIKLLVFKD